MADLNTLGLMFWEELWRQVFNTRYDLCCIGTMLSHVLSGVGSIPVEDIQFLEKLRAEPEREREVKRRNTEGKKEDRISVRVLQLLV